jgi:hypothetical protein
MKVVRGLSVADPAMSRLVFWPACLCCSPLPHLSFTLMLEVYRRHTHRAPQPLLLNPAGGWGWFCGFFACMAGVPYPELVITSSNRHPTPEQLAWLITDFPPCGGVDG